jgi:Family of unknown function (DUF5985)
VADVKVALYVIAVLSSGVCAVLLLRGYFQRRVRLLMWSGICFVGLTVNNIALFLDLVVFPAIDLRLMRLVPALIGMTFLLYGFIWDAE